jgi:two-component system response regulator AtoC
MQLPALRERREDVVPLAEYLLKKHAVPGRAVAITQDLKHALMTYHWPGNVRELENVMRKLIVLRDPDLVARELHAKAARKPLTSPSPVSPVEVAPAAAPQNAAPASVPILEQVTRAKQQAETEAILAALHSTRWNRKQAAALLKIDYKALLYKMKKLGVEDDVVPFAASPAEEAPRVMTANAE